MEAEEDQGGDKDAHDEIIQTPNFVGPELEDLCTPEDELGNDGGSQQGQNNIEFAEYFVVEEEEMEEKNDEKEEESLTECEIVNWKTDFQSKYKVIDQIGQGRFRYSRNIFFFVIH